MKIKNKTQLRKHLKSCIDNTGSLDFVEIYEDGSWAIMGCNNWSTDCVAREKVSTLLSPEMAYLSFGLNQDQIITANFSYLENN